LKHGCLLYSGNQNGATALIDLNSFRTRISEEGKRGRYSLWTVGLGIVAMSGWGAFAYSAQTSADAQRRLYQLVAELTAGQVQLFNERNEAMAYLSAARESLAKLGARVEDTRKERDGLIPQMTTSPEETPSLRPAIR
jgi:hypothetical protein